jgi:hypothetical protein
MAQLVGVAHNPYATTLPTDLHFERRLREIAPEIVRVVRAHAGLLVRPPECYQIPPELWG